MSIRKEPKHKISRRLSVNIWGDPKSPVNTRPTRPGQHGKNNKRKVSSYGLHLNEKQKIKGFYAMKEKQFIKAFKKAYSKDNVVDYFIGNLERRLDVIIFRSKLASTIFAAKQFINHRHVLVNGKLVNISSYLVRPNDIVSIKDSIKGHKLIEDSLARAHKKIPEYYDVSDNGTKVTFLKTPTIADVEFPFEFNPSLIVEFYASRM